MLPLGKIWMIDLYDKTNKFNVFYDIYHSHRKRVRRKKVESTFDGYMNFPWRLMQEKKVLSLVFFIPISSCTYKKGAPQKTLSIKFFALCLLCFKMWSGIEKSS